VERVVVARETVIAALEMERVAVAWEGVWAAEVRAAEKAEGVRVVGMVGAMEAVERVAVAMAVATEAVGRQARRQCTHLDTKGQGARCHLD
jgi:hypothetical protein